MWISLRSWHSRHGNLFTARQIQKCGEQARSVRSFRRLHQGIFESINRYGLRKYDINWLPRQIHNRHQTASYASPGSRPSPICLASQMELKRAVHLATTLRTICCSDPRRRLEVYSVPRLYLRPRIDGGVFNLYRFRATTNRDGDHSAGAAICRRLRHQGSHTGGHPEAHRLLRASPQQPNSLV